MVCARCNGPVWDNRTKKMDDPKWKTAPDFACKDKDKCGWRSGDPVSGATAAPIVAQGGSTRDSGASGEPDRTAQYFGVLDQVMEGVARRKLSDYFKPENIVAMTAAVFIAKTRG